MTRKNLIIIILFTLLSLLFYFAPLFIAQCEAAEAMPTSISYIKVPTAQWNELKQQLQEQQVTLLMLQEEITLLKKPSTELLQNLKTAREQLQKAQSELTESNRSLTNASEGIRKVSTLCCKLKVQLEKERSKVRLKARQNAFWGSVVGFIVGYLYNDFK